MQEIAFQTFENSKILQGDVSRPLYKGVLLNLTLLTILKLRDPCIPVIIISNYMILRLRIGLMSLINISSSNFLTNREKGTLRRMLKNIWKCLKWWRKDKILTLYWKESQTWLDSLNVTSYSLILVKEKGTGWVCWTLWIYISSKIVCIFFCILNLYLL